MIKGAVGRHLERKEGLGTQVMAVEHSRSNQESRGQGILEENQPVRICSGQNISSACSVVLLLWPEFSSEMGVGQASFRQWSVTWHTAWLLVPDNEKPFYRQGSHVFTAKEQQLLGDLAALRKNSQWPKFIRKQSRTDCPRAHLMWIWLCYGQNDIKEME